MATSEESVETSRLTTKLDFISESPDVFIVASLAGGTGSGIAIDLGYAVRKILGELQFPDQRVFGVLTHATSRKAASRDLAVVNTLAALQELRQFGGRRGYFPGDSSCELPAFCDDHATFHETYFVHLGNELGNREFESATDRVAEYLFQNTLGPGMPFYEQSRRIAKEGTQENSLAADRMRTFGLARFEMLHEEPVPAEPSPAPALDHDTQNAIDDTERLKARTPSLADKCCGAIPQLIACGGARQTLVLGPPAMNRDRLLEANREIPADSVTFVEHPRNEVVICQEISELPINRVMKQLIGLRKDYPELADRLHTRIDIEWHPVSLAVTD